jgi:hypothetical protein
MSDQYAVHVTYQGTGVGKDQDLCRLIEFRDNYFITVAHFTSVELAKRVALLLNHARNEYYGD